MATELSPQTEATIRELVAGGGYSDRAAVLEEGVALVARVRRKLREAVQAGIDSGKSIPGEVVFARLQARAAEIERRVETTR